MNRLTVIIVKGTRTESGDFQLLLQFMPITSFTLYVGSLYFVADVVINTNVSSLTIINAFFLITLALLRVLAF